MPRYTTVVHQAEPSIRSGYTGSEYTRSSSSYYSTSSSSRSSTPRTSDSYYNADSYTARDYAAKDHAMSVHSRGNVVVINRKHGGKEYGAPSSYQPNNWATATKDKSKSSKK